MVWPLDSGARGWGFNPHSGHCVVSLSKTHLPPKSTGKSQEAVAPSQHDWKIVYLDVKNRINQLTMVGGGARGQNVVHHQNLVFLRYSFLEVHILTTAYQTANLDHRWYPVGLVFTPQHRTPGWMQGGGARGQNLVHHQNLVFLRYSFLEVHILTSTCFKAFILVP